MGRGLVRRFDRLAVGHVWAVGHRQVSLVGVLDIMERAWVSIKLRLIGRVLHLRFAIRGCDDTKTLHRQDPKAKLSWIIYGWSFRELRC